MTMTTLQFGHRSWPTTTTSDRCRSQRQSGHRQSGHRQDFTVGQKELDNYQPDITTMISVKQAIAQKSKWYDNNSHLHTSYYKTMFVGPYSARRHPPIKCLWYLHALARYIQFLCTVCTEFSLPFQVNSAFLLYLCAAWTQARLTTYPFPACSSATFRIKFVFHSHL